jgi:phospholipase/carboxylesterase/glyoxalase family protein
VSPSQALDAFQHRFVPRAPSGTPLTLLLLHGTGGDENDLLSLGADLAPGASLLSPRGRVLENGMPRFFRRFAEGVLDVEDLKLRTRELAEFVRAAMVEYKLSDEPLYAVGFSNGANIAASMLMLEPELLAGAALLRAMVPFEPDATPALQGKRVLLAAGRRDRYSGPENTERLREIFESGGAEVTVHWSNVGHALVQADVDAAAAWFSRARAGGGS